MSTHRVPVDLAAQTPISLPLAVVTVGEIGAVSVLFDGAEFPPLALDKPWTLVQFGDLLGTLTQGRTRTVRVEVHEFDRFVFTEIIHAVQREQAIADVQPLSAIRRARHRPTHQLIDVTGSGFVPGEDVTVALSVSNAEGSADGSAQAVIDLSQLMDHRSEILLIGRVSGVVTTEPLPS